MNHKTEELVERFKSSGLSQEVFCKRKHVPVSTLQYHLSKFRRQGRSVPDTSAGFVRLEPASPLTPESQVVVLRCRFSPNEIADFVRSVEG